MKKIDSQVINDSNKIDISTNKKYEPEYHQFITKIDSNHYSFNVYPCPICESTDFHVISKSDRFFLPSDIAICCNCGLVQLSKRLSEDNYNEFYHSGEYQKLCMDGLDDITHFYYEYKLMAQYFVDYFNELNINLLNKKILEIGCGSGGILLRLSEMGGIVKGFDLDPVRVKRGQQFGLDIECADAQKIPDELLKSYDIILLSNVIEHLHNPRALLQKVYDAMNEKQLLIIDVPCTDNIIEYSPGNGVIPFFHISHIWYFSQGSLNNFMGSIGFDLINIKIRGAAFTTIWKKGISKKEIKNEYIHILKRIRYMNNRLIQLVLRLNNFFSFSASSFFVVLNKLLMRYIRKIS